MGECMLGIREREKCKKKRRRILFQAFQGVAPFADLRERCQSTLGLSAHLDWDLPSGVPGPLPHRSQ